MSRIEKIVVGFGSLVAAMGFWGAAFRSPQRTGFADWQFFQHMWEAGFVAMVRFGEWPLWDPYHCGGITIFRNPQSQHFSPLFFLSFVIGTTLAIKISILLHTAAGFAGMYILARCEYKLKVIGSALASAGWTTSGFFAWHLAGGHSAFQPFYLTPWLLYAFRWSARDYRYCAVVAAFMTFTLLEGGVYPFPYFALLLAFDAVARLHNRKQRGRILRSTLFSAVLTSLLGSIRLLPILEELQYRPRTTRCTDRISFLELIEMLTSRNQQVLHGSYQYGWLEQGSFVGWGIVIMGMIGVIPALRTGRKHLVAGLLIFGWLALGNHGPISLWPWLHKLPPFDSLRICARFTVFFTFYLALLAGLSLQQLDNWCRSLALRPAFNRLLRTASGMLLLGLVFDILWVNLPIVDKWYGPPVAVVKPAKRFYLTYKHLYGRWAASLPRLGIGTYHCYEAMNFTVASDLWAGDRPQARIEKGSGTVHDWGRTTSTAWAQVSLKQAARVVFNQNYAPGWQASKGLIASDNGRLAVDLPAGRHRIELYYQPSTLWLSIGISLFGLLATACFVWYLSLRKRQTRYNS